MLETIISSKTRLKLLLKFFLNKNAKGYLRSLEQEFGESTNAIRLELNKFESAGLLSSQSKGNKKVFHANESHPLFENLHGLVVKYVGLDKVIRNINSRLGNVQQVFLVGDYAEGRDSGIIDLFVIAKSMNLDYFVKLIQKMEKEIDRKIRYAHFSDMEQVKEKLLNKPHLLLWQQGDENLYV